MPAEFDEVELTDMDGDGSDGSDSSDAGSEDDLRAAEARSFQDSDAERESREAAMESLSSESSSLDDEISLRSVTITLDDISSSERETLLFTKPVGTQ